MRKKSQNCDIKFTITAITRVELKEKTNHRRRRFMLMSAPCGSTENNTFLNTSNQTKSVSVYFLFVSCASQHPFKDTPTVIVFRWFRQHQNVSIPVNTMDFDLFIFFLSQSSCTGYTPTGVFTHLPRIQTNPMLNFPLRSERLGHCFSLLVGGQTLLWARGSPRPNRASEISSFESLWTVLWLLAEIRWQTRHDAKAKAG